MKYVLIFLLVLLVAWRWRSARTQQRFLDQKKQELQRDAAVTMVACACCGVHLPQTEAIAGARGLYCSTPHLRQSEHS